MWLWVGKGVVQFFKVIWRGVNNIHYTYPLPPSEDTFSPQSQLDLLEQFKDYGTDSWRRFLLIVLIGMGNVISLWYLTSFISPPQLKQRQEMFHSNILLLWGVFRCFFYTSDHRA